MQENGSLLAVNYHTKHEVQWNVEGKENITGIIQQSPCTSTQIFPTVSTPPMRIWRMLHKGQHSHISSAFSTLNKHTCLATWNSDTGLILTPKWFTIFCLLKKSILPVMESKLQQTSFWSHDNPYITV